MPLDRTAHFSGTFAEAEQRSAGFDLSAEERMLWACRAAKAAFGLALDKPARFDKTAFSMRKNLLTAIILLAAIFYSTAIAQTSGTFTDSRDSKTYKWVKIGTQTWMAENLNYNAKGSRCYNDSIANCEKYGRLYDWKTAMKACPGGWHLPSDAEWDTLFRFVDGTSGTDSLYRSKTAGKLLKTANGWNNNDKGESNNGTDDYGFSALPGGIYHYYDNDLGNKGSWWIGSSGSWWSASEGSAYYAYDRYMGYNYEYLYYYYYEGMSYGFSVRCVRDLTKQ